MEDLNADFSRETEYQGAGAVYANNIRFEQSVWDLRLLFGQLMSNEPPNSPEVDWHTDVTIPWAQAKLMHLYLGVNLAVFEAQNGNINIPEAVLPPPMTIPPADTDPNNPQAMATFQIVQRLVNGFREAEARKR